MDPVVELGAHEPLAEHLQRHALDRLIMLSDGVFAIAITLAALEIRVPEHWSGDFLDLWRQTGRGLIAFGVSFIVTGFYWVGHRRMLARVRRVDGGLTLLNLLLLALVALLPALCRLIIVYDPRNLNALIVYLGFIALMGAVQGLFWAYAAFLRDLLFTEVSVRYRWAQLLTSSVTPAATCGFSMLFMTAQSDTMRLACGVIYARRWVLARWERS